eukprot:527676-Rhodomonas_salina.1
MLHRQWYTDVKSVDLAPSKSRSDVGVVRGHLLKIQARCKMLSQSVSIYNIYQHVASCPDRQQRLWDVLLADISSVSAAAQTWLAGGDFNAAGAGQRWGYTPYSRTAKADSIL